jgi:hypothetical protein
VSDCPYNVRRVNGLWNSYSKLSVHSRDTRSRADCLVTYGNCHRISEVSCSYTYITPAKQPHGAVLLQKLTVTQLVNKFPAFYGTRRFIIMFTTARHWSLSWARWIQFTTPTLFPYDTYFPSTPRSSKWSLSFTFYEQHFVCIYHLSHACYML